MIMLGIIKNILLAIQDILANIYHDPEDVKDLPMNQPIEVPPKNLLNALCLGIQREEGFILNPPSRSVRNNNPGNCRYSSVGYLAKYGKVGRDKDNFAIFKDYETGFLYLKNLILEKARQHPDWNLFDLFKEYAPVSDGNNPIKYAQNVGIYTNLNPATFRLKSLLP